MKRLSVCLSIAVLVAFVGCGDGGGGPAGPDLQVESVTFSPASVEVGLDLTVSTTATNAGDEDAAATDITIHLSSNTILDISDHQIGSRAVGALTAGETEAAAVDTVITITDAVPAGTYYVLTEIDNAGSVTESDETNNVTASASGVTITRTPDLTVDSISIGVTSVAVSEQVTVDRRLRNLGSGDAGAFDVEYYLSSDTTIDGGDFLAGTENVTGLASATDDVDSFVISSGSTAGTYYVLLSVDSADAVTETDELNNEGQAAQQLTVVASGQPDLEAEIVNAPVTMYVGETVSVDIAANNIGTASVPAGTWTCELYLSDDLIVDGADDVLGTIDTTATPVPGGSYTYTFSFTVPDHTGSVNFILVVDLNDDVTESNEGNNQAEQGVTVSTPPDLTTYAAPVTTTGSPAAARAGGAVDYLWAHIEELNSVAPGLFCVSGYISADDTITTGDTEIVNSYIASWSAGAAGSASMTGTVPAGTQPGMYNFGCIVDSQDDVFESNETNNTDTAPDLLDFEVLPAALSSSEYDLVMTNVWVSELAEKELNPGEWYNSLVPGTDFKTEGIIKTLGGDPGTTFRVGVYLSEDQTITTGDTLVGYQDFTHTEATSLLESRLQIPCTMPAALTTDQIYYLGGIVDTLDVVTETDETNNVCENQQWILVVDAASDTDINLFAEGSDGPPLILMETNQPINFGYSVRTYSNCESGAFDVNFYLSVDQDLSTAGDNTLVGSVTFPDPGLPAGDQGPDMQGYWAELTATTPGTYYLGYIVDEADAVSETNEGDNSWIADNPLTVSASGGPDLINVIYFGDEGPSAAPTYFAQVGDTVTQPLVVVANFGTQDVAAGTVVNFYASVDNTLPPDPAGDTLLGTCTCSAIAAGRYYFIEEPTTLDLSPLSAGTYYIYSVIDPAPGSVSEIDENNNDSASLDLGDGALGFVPLTVSADDPFKAELLPVTVDTDDTYWLNGEWTWVWTDCEVTNQSMSTESAPSVVSFWISEDNTPSIGASDAYLGSDVLGYIKPSGRERAEFGGNVPFIPSEGVNYYIKVVVDSLEEVDEIDEANNIAVSGAFLFVP